MRRRICRRLPTATRARAHNVPVELDRLYYVVDAQTSALEQGMARAESLVKNFARVASNTGVLIGTMGAAALTAAYKVEKFAEAWDHSLRRINTVLKVGESELQNYGAQLLEIFRGA